MSALDPALTATWPSAETVRIGGLAVPRGDGGGGRVSAARAVSAWSEPDIDAAAAQQRAWGEPPLVMVADRDETLAAALSARGWVPSRPVAVLVIDPQALTDRPIPPVTAFALWPPLAIQRQLWTEGGIGPSRQRIMERAPAPRAALLGRLHDHPAGAGFVAIHDATAVLHALVVIPRYRRQGMGEWLIRRAARFAVEGGAGRLMLAVGCDNAPALALYRRLGFAETGGYSYWSPAG